MSRVVGKKTEYLRRLYGATPEAYRAFAYGFAAGQAEKVHLGACPAAMFRPSLNNFEWLRAEAEVIASHYGLRVTVLDSHCPKTPYEIWIHRDTTEVGGWLKHPPDSEAWHRLRAAACGIPPAQVDTQYHLRKGYGEQCD